MRVLLLVAAMLPVEAQAQGPAKPPQIVAAAVSQFEDGPAGEAFLAGETVFYSFQLRGYGVSAEGKVRFTYRIEVLDPDGVPLVEPKTGEVETELTDRDKDWLPKVRHDFVIPPHAPPGRFRIQSVVREGSVPREAKAETLFAVDGLKLDTSGPLSVRGVRFYAGEDDRAPLPAAVYKGGETLWARFYVTGFQRAEKNRMRVAYGITILNPAGKALFSEPQAAVEEDAPFYPKRYVPGVASLTVQPRTVPGEYTLLITARDEIGNQTAEASGVFRIE
jgi:hypothetical protein